MMTNHTTLDDIKELLRSAGSYKFDDKNYHLKCNTTDTSPILTNIETENLTVGDKVFGDGIPKFSTILSIDSVAHTVTLTDNATATATDETILFDHSGEIEFESRITGKYDTVEYEIMYPAVTEETYNYINDEITDLSLYNSTFRLVVLAERYFIASEFLKIISDAEFENRQSEREFKVQSGIGTSISGRTGKGYVSDQMSKRAYELLTAAGYNNTTIRIKRY